MGTSLDYNKTNEPRSTGDLHEAIANWVGAKRYLLPECSLTSISSEIGFKPSHINRALIQTYGTSFSKFIDNLRIDYIKEIDLNSQDTEKIKLSSLARSGGFKTYIRFASAVRRRYKMCPRTFMVLLP
ncbi:helix-turn-helix domain-containing protein [Sphingobacterium sp. 1.A.5]|uniref:helix-turn-helix domain-containing protein n=1 Tax=Sphingobacterium sp. 1.A.5 TaxID=2044604 RepID=UPI000C0BEDCC